MRTQVLHVGHLLGDPYGTLASQVVSARIGVKGMFRNNRKGGYRKLTPGDKTMTYLTFISETPEPLRNTANGIFQRKNLWIFPPWGLLTFAGNPVICAGKTQIPPSREWRKLSQKSCNGLFV